MEKTFQAYGHELLGRLFPAGDNEDRFFDVVQFQMGHGADEKYKPFQMLLPVQCREYWDSADEKDRRAVAQSVIDGFSDTSGKKLNYKAGPPVVLDGAERQAYKKERSGREMIPGEGCSLLYLRPSFYPEEPITNRWLTLGIILGIEEKDAVHVFQDFFATLRHIVYLHLDACYWGDPEAEMALTLMAIELGTLCHQVSATYEPCESEEDVAIDQGIWQNTMLNVIYERFVGPWPGGGGKEAALLMN